MVSRRVSGGRLLAIFVAGVALTGGGCGGGDETDATSAINPARAGDPETGKRVFYFTGCEGCHVLADAGSIGTIGPDLDKSKPSYDLVVARVLNSKGRMNPYRGQLTDQEIADLATYVVSATAP